MCRTEMASDLFEIGAVTAGLITENSLELRDPSDLSDPALREPYRRC